MAYMLECKVNTRKGKDKNIIWNLYFLFRYNLGFLTKQLRLNFVYFTVNLIKLDEYVMK